MPTYHEPTLEDAKARLDSIIAKARIDLYKPIQIAEVLYYSRSGDSDVDTSDLETYRRRSIHWRDLVSTRILGKISTSSAKFQDNIWEANAMPPELLVKMDEENKRTSGAVEKYIYLKFQERQQAVANIITLIENASPETFKVGDLFDIFEFNVAVRRSVDKVYEVVVYSLLETVVLTLQARVTVSVSDEQKFLLPEFSDLTTLLLGISEEQSEAVLDAHVYRAGVTNAADRGLDMWANFGPTIQVKHLTLNPKLAQSIVNQVQSDNVIVVCRSADRQVIEIVLQQIDWGRKVRGIITEADLERWYERCLRGKYASFLAQKLLTMLSQEFKREFPQAAAIVDFIDERDYMSLASSGMWNINLVEELRMDTEVE